MEIEAHDLPENRFRAIYGSLVPSRVRPAALGRKIEELFALDGSSTERELRKLVIQGRPHARLTWHIGWALQDYYPWLNGPVLLWQAGHLTTVVGLHVAFARMGARVDADRMGTRALTRDPLQFPDPISEAIYLSREHLLGTHDAIFPERDTADASDTDGACEREWCTPSHVLHWERVWDAWNLDPVVRPSDDVDLRMALAVSQWTKSLSFGEREVEISERLDRAATRRLSRNVTVPWEANARLFYQSNSSVRYGS